MHKKLENSVFTYQDVLVSKNLSSGSEIRHVFLRHLDPDQYVRACPALFWKKEPLYENNETQKLQWCFIMVQWWTQIQTYGFIMEKANVPTWTERVQEVHQSTMSLREAELVEKLFSNTRSSTHLNIYKVWFTYHLHQSMRVIA